jgi:beta-N-acetylhexosaminidase
MGRKILRKLQPVGRATIVALALWAFIAVGLVAGASRGASASADPSVTGLSDDLLAGTRVVTGIGQGQHPSRELEDMISTGRLSGVILYSRNAGDRAAVRQLTRELQAIPRPAAVSQPLLIMVDQEGGLVRRLPGPPKPSASEIGRRGPDYAQRLGAATGRSLHSMGVNVNLAPVLDLGRHGGMSARQKRTFGRDAKRVSKRGGAFAQGLESGGVAAVAKHFPGLGAARTDPDVRQLRIRLSAATLRKADETPFAGFFGAGGRMVMLATAIYPALAPQPAAFSHKIATDELRGRLGFSGVSMTDALDAPAALAFGGAGRAAVAAAGAGTDLVLFSSELTLSQAADAQHALTDAIASGSLSRSDFEASAARVLALRQSLGG